MPLFFLRLRYILEIIAFPAFAFLVVHLSGHGVTLFLEGENDHHEHGGEHIEDFFSFELLAGILLALLFAKIWSFPAFKKWVPCRHEHCQHAPSLPHIIATIAFCLHFFPEAIVRHALIENALQGEVISLISIIGFATHFLVDILVTFVLSFRWVKTTQKILSITFIVFLWGIAFWGSNHLNIEILSPLGEGLLFLLSAFFLAMFLHKPHKPISHCHNC